VISTRRAGGLGAAPGAVPLLGHAVRFLHDPLAFLRTAHGSGDVVLVRFGPTRAYLVCAPQLVWRVLTDTRVFGRGTGAAGPVQTAFHRSRIVRYTAMISEQVEVMTSAWRPRQVVDLNVVMHRLTTTVALRMLFASRATTEVVTEVHERLPAATRDLYRWALLPLAPRARENRRFRAARQELHDLVGELVYASSTEDESAVAALRAAGLAGQELHDHVAGLLAGGVRPTVATLCWTFALLSQNHDARRRLHEEVDTVLGGRPAGYDDLWRLDHTRRVVTETLRLYPPLWVLTRQAAEETELAGHVVPAGATVLLSPYALHRDPELFPAPDEFDPDRWLPERAESVPQGAWVPFGAGGGKCVGDVFATVQATIAVAMIASRWRLFSTGVAPTPVPRGELGTGPLPMIVQSRNVAFGHDS
jgi:pentalenene oxygenase